MNGARADDAKSRIAFAPNTKLSTGVGTNIVSIKPESGRTVDVVILTNRGSTAASISPYVDQPAIQAFSISPQSINAGETATLSWNVPGADSVTIDNNIGTVAPSGKVVVTPKISTTYTLTARKAGAESLAPGVVQITVNPVVMVSNLQIHLHTTDENKDDNTGLRITLGNNAAIYQQAGKEKFNDDSDHHKVFTPSVVKLSDISGKPISICISPRGNDTWKFNFTVSGTRSDGPSYQTGHSNNVLSQRNKCGSWTMP